MRSSNIYTLVLIALAPSSVFVAAATPRPRYCKAISQLVSTLSLEASATPFCQSFLSMSTRTTTTVDVTTTPLATAPTKTITVSTETDSATVTSFVTSTLTTESIILVRRVAQKTKPVATPSALSGRASKIASKACVCLDVAPPTTTVSVTSTVSISVTTPITDVTVTSDYVSSTTATIVTTSYTTTQTCPSAAFTSPIMNGGFDTGSIDPWSVSADYDGYNAVVSRGYESDHSFEVVLSGPANNGVGEFYTVIRQGVTLCPGVTYTVSYQVLFEVNHGGSCSIQATVGSDGFQTNSDQTPALGQFQEVSFQTTANAESEFITITFACYNVNNTMRADSVVFTPM